MTVGRPGAVLASVALASVVLASVALAGCGGSGHARYNPAATSRLIADAVAAGLPSPKVTVLGTLPHSTDAYTEGLEISDGMLYEGTGLAGRSELRQIDPKTGRLIRSAPLPNRYFGEGITVVGSLIWQLTYRDGLALQWHRETFNAGGRVPWTGEGWGLCHNSDGELIASNGSPQLRTIDRTGTEVVTVRTVRLRGQPLGGLNELECGTGVVWANVFGTDWVVSIDLDSGEVTAAMDAAKLYPRERRGGVDSVLNGIAAIPGTDTFLLTGKYWPNLFRVRFGP